MRIRSGGLARRDQWAPLGPVAAMADPAAATGSGATGAACTAITVGAGGAGDAGSGDVVDGRSPVERRRPILFSTSNQNGAPSERAPIVKARPSSLTSAAPAVSGHWRGSAGE